MYSFQISTSRLPKLDGLRKLGGGGPIAPSGFAPFAGSRRREGLCLKAPVISRTAVGFLGLAIIGPQRFEVSFSLDTFPASALTISQARYAPRG